MKINEMAQRVGMTTKNIRFYEQEGLLSPQRNRQNGYRSYGPQEEETLRRIKLMRKLGLPLEEIRQMQTGRLTLSEGMRRQLAELGRQQKNLAEAQEFCTRLQDCGADYDGLDADQWLREMELKEKEGTVFVNKQNRDHRAKSVAAICAAAVFALLMLCVVALLIWAWFYDPIPIGIVIGFCAVCLIPVFGVGLALIQRLKEIKGGEEDAARNY